MSRAIAVPVRAHAPALRRAQTTRPALVAPPRSRYLWRRCAVGIVIVGTLGGTAVMQSLLAQSQIQLDTLQQDFSELQAERAMLRLQLAEMEAPNRIVDAAEQRLGMVRPERIAVVELPVATGQLAVLPVDESIRQSPGPK